MSKPKRAAKRSRREFLKGSALAGAGVTVAAALPGAAAAAPPDSEPETPDDKYRLTPHIADYYKTLS